MELLVSPPIQAPGNRMQGSALSFQRLEKKVQLTQLCEKNLLPTSCNCRELSQNRPNADDGWRRFTPMCREYSSSRSYPNTKALSAIPEGTIIGPVSEVHVVKNLDRYCMEVAFQSIANPEYTTYVVISREEERFVNETSGPAMNCSQTSTNQEGMKSWAAPSTNKCRPFHPCAKSVPIHKKEPFLRMIRSG